MEAFIIGSVIIYCLYRFYIKTKNEIQTENYWREAGKLSNFHELIEILKQSETGFYVTEANDYEMRVIKRKGQRGTKVFHILNRKDKIAIGVVLKGDKYNELFYKYFSYQTVYSSKWIADRVLQDAKEFENSILQATPDLWTLKKSVAFILLLIGFNSYSQDLTEKYNSMQQRYEYFNSNGDLVGHKQWNTFSRAWEYYEDKVEPMYSPPQSNVNLPLLQQTLELKQGNYNANTQRLQQYINELYNSTKTNLTLYDKGVDISPYWLIDKINKRFTDECLSVINKKHYDYSNASVTNKVMDWLNSSYKKIFYDELNAMKKTIENH